jgi:hypothetical protein
MPLPGQRLLGDGGRHARPVGRWDNAGWGSGTVCPCLWSVTSIWCSLPVRAPVVSLEAPEAGDRPGFPS